MANTRRMKFRHHVFLLLLFAATLSTPLPIMQGLFRNLFRTHRYHRLGPGFGRQAGTGNWKMQKAIDMFKRSSPIFGRTRARYSNFRARHPNIAKLIDVSMLLGSGVGLTIGGNMLEDVISNHLKSHGVQDQTMINSTIGNAREALDKVMRNSKLELERSGDTSMYDAIHSLVGNDTLFLSTAKLQSHSQFYIPDYEVVKRPLTQTVQQ